jgi:hypothetical protein
VDGGAKYVDRLLTVHGCFVHEFEISILKPCERKTDEFNTYSIWVDDIEDVTKIANVKKESPFITEESKDVLEGGRKNFWKLAASRDHPIPVILLGEYQTQAIKKYGHLSGYRHRFIVHKMVSSEMPDRRP